MIDKSLTAPIGSLVTHKGIKYRVSEQEIQAGDLVWNQASGNVDKCIAILGDDIVVQFSSGHKACLWRERYQRIIRLYLQ